MLSCKKNTRQVNTLLCIYCLLCYIFVVTFVFVTYIKSTCITSTIVLIYFSSSTVEAD